MFTTSFELTIYIIITEDGGKWVLQKWGAHRPGVKLPPDRKVDSGRAGLGVGQEKGQVAHPHWDCSIMLRPSLFPLRIS